MSGERTEAATPRRLSTLRDEGRTARSVDLSSAAALLAGFFILQAFASAQTNSLQELMTVSFIEMQTVHVGVNAFEDDYLWAGQTLGRAAETWLRGIWPVITVLPLLGIGMTLAQGAALSVKALFSWQRVNPLSGFKRLFGMQSLVQMVRSCGKVMAVGWVTFGALSDTIKRLPAITGSSDPRQIASFLGESAMSVGLAGAQVLFGLAIVDYAYQRWQFGRDSRMTKQEVKEDHRQQEGDPHVKARIAAQLRKLATTQRQLLDVPKAAVVITNPTHLAVAIQYDADMRTPKIVAKGADLIAERIKQLAREAGVPTIENKPLARGLYGSAEVGDEIPLELYQAVAGVLAYVLRLKHGKR